MKNLAKNKIVAIVLIIVAIVTWFYGKKTIENRSNYSNQPKGKKIQIASYVIAVGAVVAFFFDKIKEQLDKLKQKK